MEDGSTNDHDLGGVRFMNRKIDFEYVTAGNTDLAYSLIGEPPGDFKKPGV